MAPGERAARWVLIASALAAVSYVATWNTGLTPGINVIWKGAGVALLAVYAALKARDTDGWLICLVMGFGAAGDMLLETHGHTVGGLAFLAGHLTAIGLYLRNRRPSVSRSQLALAIMLVPATVLIAFLLPEDRAGAPGVALYAAGLSLMAATAWTSRFPRLVVGVGAVMFVVSDLLIFARSGHRLPDNLAAGIAVWGLYYFGQLLICVGVTGALAHWQETQLLSSRP